MLYDMVEACRHHASEDKTERRVISLQQDICTVPRTSGVLSVARWHVMECHAACCKLHTSLQFSWQLCISKWICVIFGTWSRSTVSRRGLRDICWSGPDHKPRSLFVEIATTLSWSVVTGQAQQWVSEWVSESSPTDDFSAQCVRQCPSKDLVCI